MDKAWAGVDAGKEFHWVHVLDASGRELLSRTVENDQAGILKLIDEALSFAKEIGLGTRSVRRWGSALVGTLWRSCGNAIREVSLHPPGLTVDRAREAYRGEPKTDACDARIIAHPRRG